jgi:hypothetical protein
MGVVGDGMAFLIYSNELGDLFAGVLLRVRGQMEQPDPEAAVRAAFTTVFSALVVRVAYGQAIAAPDLDEDTFLETLGTMVSRHLLWPRSST